ncbi:MAG: PEP-CTERM sorting domain-containing protein [Planctomycetes bacterium]|nr:PEP-CTERM sorting domain-containing protein [Planctomycetota bacterium]
MPTIRRTLCRGLLAALLAVAGPGLAQALTFTFAPGQYDNTVNTVTGTNASPSYNNNQTTGNFRDVFWWGKAYNGGIVGVGSPDFINSNKNLISNGGSPARAIVGGNYDALNFTGLRLGGGLAGASFLSIYDQTPNVNATKNLFDASVPGGLTISADVLFSPGTHTASAGIVTLYSGGQNGLALLAKNGGGNNPDVSQLDLVFQTNGTGTVIQSTSVGSSGTQFTGEKWYRIEMNVSVSGDAFTVTGKIFDHLTPSDPTSALGNMIGNVINYNGSLSSPGNALDLTNPGEIGLMAMTTENFNDGVNTGQGGTGANPLVDNIGVSITNFQFDDPVHTPEPATWMLAAVGAAVLGVVALRKRRANRRTTRQATKRSDEPLGHFLRG